MRTKGVSNSQEHRTERIQASLSKSFLMSISAFAESVVSLSSSLLCLSRADLVRSMFVGISLRADKARAA